MKLFNLYKIQKATTTSREFFINNSGIKCVHYGDIYKNYSFKFINSSNIINSFSKDVKTSLILKEDSIIIPDVTETVSDYGHPTYIKYDGTPYINGTHALAITSNGGNLKYLFYYLQNPSNIKRLQSLLLGSTVFGISIKDFEKFELKEYESDRTYQQHIVDIIGSIDDKIENNNKIMDKLDEFMILKYRRIYTEALKSDNQVHLENIIDLKTGKKDANAANENGKYPFFTCSENNSRIDEYSFDQEAILIAGNGNMSVKYYKGKFDAYQRTYVIGSKKYFYYIYLYYKNFIKEISVGARGSVIKFLTKSMLVDIDMPIADEHSMKTFENEIKEILNSIMSLETENKKLNELKQKYLLKFF